MKTAKLHYDLPAELIAQRPPAKRTDARLLVLDRASGELTDSRFAELGDFLVPGDCLVLNDTKVLPARFFARRRTGGRVEGLFLAEDAPGTWEVMLKGTGRLKTGETLHLKNRDGADCCQAVLLEKIGQGRCLLRVESDAEAETLLEAIGFAPLPPYIKRGDDTAVDEIDKARYQTVYARVAGAVAAPTAGLHFSRSLIHQLQDEGVEFAYVTLHVGAGTFKPVTTENLEDHQMHAERFSIDAGNAHKINAAMDRGSRIVAVGTTSTRVLETFDGPRVRATAGQTELFITPGYQFKLVRAMVTNFHLPSTTLLALVAAFAGLEKTLAAYRHAVEQRYRFYSYGDAMMIV